MTDKPKDGGPAFPITGSQRNPERPGMSLRDYFAAQALAGLVSTIETEENARDIGIAAYGIADRMMKARGQA
jgi:hypothetical protein